MKNFTKRVITGLSLGALFWIAFAYLPPIYFSWLLFIILVQISVFEWRNFLTWTILFFGRFCRGTPFYPSPYSSIWTTTLSTTIFFLYSLFLSQVTTLAHIFVGSFFGKHKIAPSVSPGKTWEGFCGGILFACAGLWLVLHEIQVLKSPLMIIAFASFVCILALCGDLFESWLKRRAGIKDSGDILPGHGGFLDRFDGILFAVFFFYFFRNYLVGIFS